MRRLLALLTVGALTALAIGAAAQLDIQNDVVLQSGSDTDLTCDDNGVTVAFVTELDGIETGEVSGVRVSDISTDCEGLDLGVVATQDGAFLEDGGLVEITDTEHVVDFDSPQSAEAITDIHVHIES